MDDMKKVCSGAAAPEQTEESGNTRVGVNISKFYYMRFDPESQAPLDFLTATAGLSIPFIEYLESRLPTDMRADGKGYLNVAIHTAQTCDSRAAHAQLLAEQDEWMRRQGLLEGGESFSTIADEPPAWEAPIPFETAATPPFPVEMLPAPLDAFAEAVAESTQTPEEMAGLLLLGLLALCFQKRFIVQITPDWTEPLCLYTVAIAPPGERKSAVIAAVTRPVHAYETEQWSREGPAVAQNRAQRALLEKRLEAAKNAAVRTGEDDEVLALAAQLADFRDIRPTRLLTDDSTPERLVDLMEGQGGCLTVASAEGGLFDTIKGRYDNKGGLDVYLKAQAGDPIVVDRVGRRGNIIQNPRLTMLLTVQPDVLRGLMADRTFRGRGLCGRFLYAQCRSRIGRRAVSPPPVPEDVRAAYAAFVHRALSARDSGVITLSPAADRLRQDFQGWVEIKLGTDWEYMRDWGGKLTGAMVRIAALLHCVTAPGNPADTPISGPTMEAAMKLALFLADHAEVVYRQMGGDPAQADAEYILRHLEGVEEISRRDLFARCKGHFHRVASMQPALKLLAERNYIRTRTDSADTRGRPSEIIIVNPCLGVSS